MYNAIHVTMACCPLHNICEDKGGYFGHAWRNDCAGLEVQYKQSKYAPCRTGFRRAKEVRNRATTHPELGGTVLKRRVQAPVPG